MTFTAPDFSRHALRSKMKMKLAQIQDSEPWKQIEIAKLRELCPAVSFGYLKAFVSPSSVGEFVDWVQE